MPSVSHAYCGERKRGELKQLVRSLDFLEDNIKNKVDKFEAAKRKPQKFF